MAKENSGKNAPVKMSDKINGFIQRNRKILVICLIAIVAGTACFIVGFVVRDRIQEKAWNTVEEYITRYDAIKASVYLSDHIALINMPDVIKLKDELAEFARKNSGFPSARAHSIIAEIYEDAHNWPEAEKSWLDAAKAAGKNYFVPVSYFRAALAAEEQGKLTEAIGYYEECVNMKDIFPAAPRAMFSIARLQETQGQNTAAILSYQNLLLQWPYDPFWTRLAQSRIIALGGDSIFGGL